MRKVITVSLNGNAFQLEDDAYAALSTYLEEAARALAANPDRAEIISDLEQAIADKCAMHVGPHKGVVTRSEIEQVIAQMGPVDAEPAPASASGAGTSGSASSGTTDPNSAPRRLYQISEGAMVSGVCNGYAAYSGLDVTWIRVIFVLLILVTGGAALIGYLVLMFIIPYANTSEEHAAARGLPFTARQLVENAKRHYAHSTSTNRNSSEWYREKDSLRREWRRTRAEWRLERRRARQEWRRARWGRSYGSYAPPPPGAATAAPAPVPYFAHVFSGSLMALTGLVSAAIGLVMIVAIFSLINTDSVFGWPLPQGIPLWAGILGLILIWNFVALPIRAIRHSARWYGFYHGPWFAAFDGIVTAAVVIGLCWWGLHHISDIHHFFRNLPRLWEHETWSNTAARVVVKFCISMKDWLLVNPQA